MLNDWSGIELMNFTHQFDRDDIGSSIDITKPLPKNFDWRNENVVTHVKDQGHCGSCWAFAGIATIESAFAIQNNLKNKDLIEFSEQQMLDCVHGYSLGCEGGTVLDVFKYVNKFGIVKEDDYPYVDHVCNLLIHLILIILN